MATIRLKTTHAKRLFTGAFASCAAAVAMAYTVGGPHHHHGGDDAGSHQNASYALGGGLDGSPGSSSGGPGDLTDNGGLPGGDSSQGGIGGQAGSPHHNSSDGSGDGSDDHGSGLLPNGENGLIILTDFVNGLGDDGNGQGAGGGGFSHSGGEPDSDKGGPQGSPGGPGGFGGFGGIGGGGGGGGSTPGGGQPGQPNGGPGGPGGGDDGPTCLLANAVDCIDAPNGDNPPANGPGGRFPPVTFLTLDPPNDGPVGDRPGSDLLVNAPAPEPATWLTMILGFGVLGQTLRVLRRKLA